MQISIVYAGEKLQCRILIILNALNLVHLWNGRIMWNIVPAVSTGEVIFRGGEDQNRS